MRNFVNSGTSYYALLSLVHQWRRNVIPPFVSLKHKATMSVPFRSVQLHRNHPETLLKYLGKLDEYLLLL